MYWVFCLGMVKLSPSLLRTALVEYLEYIEIKTYPWKFCDGFSIMFSTGVINRYAGLVVSICGN